MAVTIITPGNSPDKRRLTGRCNNCGCKFRCLASDCKQEYDQREGTTWHRITCPQKGCGHSVIIYD